MNEAPRKTRFYRDKRNGKWLGVCSGIADYTGLDVTVIRIAVVLLTVLGSGATLIAYIVAAMIAPNKPHELAYTSPEQQKFWQGVRASPRRTVRDVRAKFRELDRRLIDVETYVTSSSGSLSREIEKLR
jgi:phage shock protein C